MAELKIKSRLHNEADILEVEDKDVEAVVNPIIQADKDIISKIEGSYNQEEQKARLIFPKGVMPISWYDNELSVCLYCNYPDREIVVDNGNIHGSIEMFDDNIEVILNSENIYNKENIVSLLFINFENTDALDDYPNWYSILNPQPAGTKLYKHVLDITDADDNEFLLTVISKSNIAIDETFSTDDINYFLNSIISCIMLQDPNGDPDLFTPLNLNTIFEKQPNSAIYFNAHTIGIVSGDVVKKHIYIACDGIADAVTPL